MNLRIAAVSIALLLSAGTRAQAPTQDTETPTDTAPVDASSNAPAVAVATPPETPDATGPARTCAGREDRISIYGGTEQDRLGACEALERALGFFVKYGLTNDKRVRMRFQATVSIPAHDGNGAATFGGGIPVVGLYDEGINLVSMTSLSSPWLKHRPYFKLPYSRELLVSVMTHEITHALSKPFYTYKKSPNAKAQEEYIGYVAQLTTMDPATRAKILKRFPESKNSFDDEVTINDLIHGFNPHGFGVMSYYHFNGPQGGKNFLDRIYSGDFRPLDFSEVL